MEKKLEAQPAQQRIMRTGKPEHHQGGQPAETRAPDEHGEISGAGVLYNAKKHSATGFAPFRLVFGREARETVNIIEQKTHHRVNTKSQIAELVSGRAAVDRETFEKAVENNTKAKEQRATTTETKRFKVGDLVWTTEASRQKTDPRRRGPLEILQVIEGGVYRVKDVKNFRKKAEIIIIVFSSGTKNDTQD